MKGVSIIICTYNRAELLTECLQSFLDQSIQPDNIEFLVINNHSTDNTREVTESFKGKLKDIRCVDESNIGLSFARNRGVHQAAYDWICYMDDDAIAHKNYLEQLFYTIDHFDFDGFGGMFYPWYRTPKPQWLSPDFGKMTLLRRTAGPLAVGKTVAGGICAFKKACIIAAGEFPTDVGMRGDVVGYGEENYLQDKMWANGNIIGFNPDWAMDHLVAEYKYTLKWHLKRYWGKGRDAQINRGRLGLLQKIRIGAVSIATIVFLGFKNLPKLILNKNYYRQNYCLDTLSHAYKQLGKISV